MKKKYQNPHFRQISVQLNVILNSSAKEEFLGYLQGFAESSVWEDDEGSTSQSYFRKSFDENDEFEEWE